MISTLCCLVSANLAVSDQKSMPIRNIDKKKSNNEETKTEWQTTFCDLVHPPSLQKKKRKNIKGNKNKMTKVAVLCPASAAAKKGQKKGNKEHAGKLLALTSSSLQLCKKRKQTKKQKKHQRQQRAEWQTTCRDLVRPPSLHDNNLPRSVTKGQCQ